MSTETISSEKRKSTSKGILYELLAPEHDVIAQCCIEHLACLNDASEENRLFSGQRNLWFCCSAMSVLILQMQYNKISPIQPLPHFVFSKSVTFKLTLILFHATLLYPVNSSELKKKKQQLLFLSYWKTRIPLLKFHTHEMKHFKVH